MLDCARKERDPIIIDAGKRQINLDIPAKEMAARRKAWKEPAPRYTRGVHESSQSTLRLMLSRSVLHLRTSNSLLHRIRLGEYVWFLALDYETMWAWMHQELDQAGGVGLPNSGNGC